jgi:nucleoside phosphorylase
MTASGSLVQTAIVVPTAFEAEAYFAHWPQLKLSQTSPWQIYTLERHNDSGQREIIRLILSFIGPANAAAATEHIIALGVDRIFNSGSAGATDPLLLPGDIVIGSTCKILCDQQTLEVRKSLLLTQSPIRFIKDGVATYLSELAADSQLLEAAQAAGNAWQIKAEQAQSYWSGPGWPQAEKPRSAEVRCGAIGSLDGWTKGLENLNFIRDTFNVDAEDMESAYIAQIAAIHSIPFLSVRAISNNEYRSTLAKDAIIPAVRQAASRAAQIVIETVQARWPH